MLKSYTPSISSQALPASDAQLASRYQRYYRELPDAAPADQKKAGEAGEAEAAPISAPYEPLPEISEISGKPRDPYAPFVKPEKLKDPYEDNVASAAPRFTPLKIDPAFERLFQSAQRIASTEITQGTYLAEGAFGKVYRGLWNTQKLEVALKQVDITHALQSLTKEQFLESFEWEIARLNALSHPNLVTFYGVYCSAALEYFLVMEFCEGGSLRSRLNNIKAGEAVPFTPAQRWQIALEIAQGLVYLHHQGILHRDLKAENILLTSDGHAKLADLGVAQADAMVAGVEAKVVQAGLSDRRFKAPEELAAGVGSSASTSASDLFAYASILWELFSGDEPDRPRRKQSIDEMLATSQERFPIPKDCPKVFADLMRACWQASPQKRLTAPQVVERLHACAANFHPQAALVLAYQQTTQQLQEYRREFQRYIPTFTTPVRLMETADAFWEKREQEDAKASSPIATVSAALDAKAQREVKGARDGDGDGDGDVDEASHGGKPSAVEHPAAHAPLSLITQELDAFLAQKEKRIFVIMAEGGLGKSTAGYQLAERLLSDLARPLTQELSLASQPLPSLASLSSSSSSSSSISVSFSSSLSSSSSSSSSASLSAMPYTPVAHPHAPALLSSQTYLPVLLRGSLPNWSHNALNNAIETAVGELADQLRNQRLLIILDGYDELLRDEEPQNLAQQLRLSAWPNAQLIVSVRPGTVKEIDEARIFGINNQQFTIHYLLPFQTFQLLDYLQRELRWTQGQKESFALTLKALPQLRAQLRNPFLLSQFVNAWPLLKDKQLKDLTRFQLLAHSVQAWLQSQITADDTAALPKAIQATLTQDMPDLTSSFYLCAERLATLGFAEQQPALPKAIALSALETPALKTWLTLEMAVAEHAKVTFQAKQQELIQNPSQRHRSILSEEDWMRLKTTALQAFLASGPFKYNVNTHDYRHRSLYEFFMAHAWLSALHQNDQARLIQLFSAQPVQSDPAILAFFQEEYATQPPEIQQAWNTELESLILTSRTNTTIAQSSANAATLLNACKVNLMNKAWSQVQLPGADLSYGMLAHSDLRQANLRGATLTHTILYAANLSQSDLREVRWGEFPRLLLKVSAEAIAHHPTQPWLAVAQENDIILIHRDTGEQLGLGFKGHTGWVRSVTFSPDGRVVASGSDDNTVRLWNVAKQIALGKPLSGHTHFVTSVTFSPDGRVVASGSWDNTVRLWSVEKLSALEKPLLEHTSSVTSVTFSPDGRVVASGSWDNTVRLWSVEKLSALGAPLLGHTEFVNSVTFSPDGRVVASGSLDNTIRLWSVEKQSALGMPLSGHTDSVTSVTFSPDGRVVASGSWDHTVRLWSVEKQSALGEPLSGHTSSVTSVTFSPDGRVLASGSWDKTVRLWSIAKQIALGEPLSGHTMSVWSVTFSPDGRVVASSGDTTVRLWSVEKLSALGVPLSGHTEPVTSVTFSPDGRVVASASRDNTVCLWNVAKQSALGVPLLGHTSSVTSVTFSRDGRVVASSGDDHTVRLWSVEKLSALGMPLFGHTEPVTSVTFSPDGRVLASGSWDDTVRLWSVEKLSALGEPLLGHTGTVTSVTFSPDGRVIASSSRDKTVRLWSVEKQSALGEPLLGHKSDVTSVTFSQDSRVVVSGSLDNTVRLWSVARRTCLAILHWPYSINSVALTAPNPVLSAVRVSDSKSAVPGKSRAAAEDYLAIGDEAGAISFWAVTRNDTPEFRFLGMPRHASMSFLPYHTDLRGCQMNPMSRRLLEQYGADVSHVTVVEEAVTTPPDSKRAAPSTTSASPSCSSSSSSTSVSFSSSSISSASLSSMPYTPVAHPVKSRLSQFFSRFGHKSKPTDSKASPVNTMSPAAIAPTQPISSSSSSVNVSALAASPSTVADQKASSHSQPATPSAVTAQKKSSSPTSTLLAPTSRFMPPTSEQATLSPPSPGIQNQSTALTNESTRS